jgi:very-short-patch-repair endonuclease
MAKCHGPTRDRAKALRQDMTEPERALWEIVRGKRLGGIKFVRQAVRPPFIPDFAARAERLIVELDGDSHSGPEAEAYDARRTTFLEDQGWRVLRIPNNEVMANPEGVARAILIALGRDWA